MNNNHQNNEEYIFTSTELMDRLNDAIGKTLGEADKAHVFNKTKNNPKITGIAGDVVEQSILGYGANSDKTPDIIVDGIPVEVKTTGIRFSKKEKGKYEAKEPMSITAVSPKSIVNETFENSHFWSKLENLLVVYYLYSSDYPVEAKDYANFYLKGYDLHKFSSDDIKVLKNDWETVKTFISDIQNNYVNPEEEYPRLSSELRDKLMFIDTAPKWPNPPRFRLKRSFVTAMVQEHFNHLTNEMMSFFSYYEVDKKCDELTKIYGGKTVEELIRILHVEVNDINKLSKAISEQIVVRMFGGKQSKINKISIFNKAGLIGKTIVLSSKGARTEDMKLFRVDFSEIMDEDMKFEESSIYDYFANHQFICIVFKENYDNQKFGDNEFVGFKRIHFDETFIEKNVHKTWNELRRLILSNDLAEEVKVDKNGKPIINKNGVIKTSINFPKSKDYKIFLRGSGLDSSYKNFILQGIKMYNQYMWIKGSTIIDIMNGKKED